MRQLVTVKEAALLVGKSPQTIYRLISHRSVRTFDSPEGMKVQLRDVQRVVAETRRGRPPREKRET